MIIIGIGANLPGPNGSTPRETCDAATTEIKNLPHLRFIAASPWYRTAPIPASDQPDYCNGVIRMDGEISPLDLLETLQAIETRFNRTRAEPNAPRTLDLDIIDLNNIIRAIPPVTLPHPRAHRRAFVLRPLVDVAPGWRHPTLRRSVTALLADLGGQTVTLWEDAA